MIQYLTPLLKACILGCLALPLLKVKAEDGPPKWVLELEQFDIPFTIEWNVEIHHRPDQKLAEDFRNETGNSGFKAHPLQIREIEMGIIRKRRIKIAALNWMSFKATVLQMHKYNDHYEDEYSSTIKDGSATTNKNSLADYSEEKGRYFDYLGTGLPQTQIISFLPKATQAKIINDKDWPKIYELASPEDR